MPKALPSHPPSFVHPNTCSTESSPSLSFSILMPLRHSYKPRNDPDGANWAYLAQCGGGGDCSTATGGGGGLFFFFFFYYYYSPDLKIQAFRVACNQRLLCENAFWMDSSNSSIATKSYACASIAFIVRIISWSVGSILPRALC